MKTLVKSMECPKCACKHSLVTHTEHRVFRGIRFTIRRRTCRFCGEHYLTRESFYRKPYQASSDEDMLAPEEPKLEQGDDSDSPPSLPPENPFRD